MTVSRLLMRYLFTALLLLLLAGAGWGWYQWESLRGRVLDLSPATALQARALPPDSLPGADSARLARWWADSPFR